MKPISRTVSLKFPNVEKRQLMHAEYSSARVIHSVCERDRTLSEFQGCTDDTDTYIGIQTRKQKNTKSCNMLRTRMWANAQRDGRPAEYRWRPMFNAAKFG